MTLFSVVKFSPLDYETSKISNGNISKQKTPLIEYNDKVHRFMVRRGSIKFSDQVFTLISELRVG